MSLLLDISIYAIKSILFDISIFAIFIPTVVGLIQFNKLDRAYSDFIFFLCAGSITEILTRIFHESNLTRAYIQVVYTLTEFILLFSYFQNWGRRRKQQSYFLGFFMICVACFDFYNIPKLTYTFRVISSLSPAILIIKGIPVLASEFNKKKFGFRNPSILILLPILVTIFLDLVFEFSMWVAYSKSTQQFFINMLYSMNVLNFLSYICFTFALIWAPKKEKFLLL